MKLLCLHISQKWSQEKKENLFCHWNTSLWLQIKQLSLNSINWHAWKQNAFWKHTALSASSRTLLLWSFHKKPSSKTSAQQALLSHTMPERYCKNSWTSKNKYGITIMESKAISLWLSEEIPWAKSSLMHRTQSLEAVCYRIYRIFYITKDCERWRHTAELLFHQLQQYSLLKYWGRLPFQTVCISGQFSWNLQSSCLCSEQAAQSISCFFSRVAQKWAQQCRHINTTELKILKGSR